MRTSDKTLRSMGAPDEEAVVEWDPRRFYGSRAGRVDGRLNARDSAAMKIDEMLT
ncbi:hypothetical protein G3480_15055 [Thiorhodococcus mannitoliphagus]|uniref:Uncharacterized protein n=1 Tax=Thiorhodococcus mannitoliphagus TaxID=329406 RepID=A0A6P1DZM1_9GAMM|nr:hypothetical protein [Thiorhodococcus mannitoliphagus]NEX21612.1 hypothetical protein [Thiorhodococcus mannitoliphagus]